VTREYDRNNNLSRVDNGFSRRVLRYDENDNLTEEDIAIDGVLYPVRYDYESHDYLGAITYPTGRVVAYNPDGLGRPTQAAPYITDITYHPNG